MTFDYFVTEVPNYFYLIFPVNKSGQFLQVGFIIEMILIFSTPDAILRKSK